MTFCPRAYLESAEVRANAEIREPSIEEALSFSRPADESSRQLQGIYTMDLQGATETSAGLPGRYSKLIKAIESAIQTVTGRPFKFVSMVHPKQELRVRWGDSAATFDITTLPDGLRSILGWLVQGVVWMDVFHNESPDPLNQPVILLIDEPETHLHPEWQWRVLPMMQRLFPKAQIFVATHSPFVVSSLNENAWIHRLKVGDGGKVFVEEAKKAERGDSYVTALTEVLGVMGWFDPENQGLLEEFQTLKSAALGGEAGKELEMMGKAQEIAARGLELEQIIGMEVQQYRRQKEQKAKAAKA
jgi:predicted ATP-binding protein involved in virulence